jgi:choline dehydrogenase-like flavoprotein
VEAEVAVAEGSLPTTKEKTLILTLWAAHLVLGGQDADEAEAKVSGINSSYISNPKIRHRELSRWLRAGTLNNRTTTKGMEEAGVTEEAIVPDMAEESTKISQINGGNINNSLNNSMEISRLNNSEDTRNRPNNMGKVDKCIRHILAENLKITKISTTVRKEVANTEAEVHIKEGLPMTIQIQA